MKLIVNSENVDFRRIKTTVMYRWFKYVPKNIPTSPEKYIPNFTSDNIQYRGSLTNSDLDSFAEYDFKHKISKGKFNNDLIINKLDNTSLDLIGTDLEDTLKIEKVIFPTLTVEEDLTPKYKYFGSTTISNQELLIFDVAGTSNAGEGYWKIELYDDNIVTNNSKFGGFVDSNYLELIGADVVKPVLTIQLGPEELTFNNPDSMYFSDDTNLIDKSNYEPLSILKYRELFEEITMNKVVWSLISSDTKLVEINLALKSWNSDIDPNRNMKDWILRNDEFYSTVKTNNKVSTVEGTNYYFSDNTTTLLGNFIVPKDSCILLNRKIAKSNSEIYSPYLMYSLGDTVSFAGEIWESLSDGNKGNNPILSNNWLLSSEVRGSSNLFRVTILTSPIEGGISSPSGTITMEADKTYNFNIIEYLGYRLSNDPCSVGPGLFLKPTDYTITEITSEVDQKIYKQISILNPRRILETNNLTFNFEPVNSNFRFTAELDGVIKEYLDWKEYFVEPNFQLNSLIVDNEVMTIPLNQSDFDIALNSEFNCKFNSLRKYEIVNIEAKYVSSGKLVNEYLSINPTETYLEFNDVCNFNDAVYNLVLSLKIFNIEVNHASNVEVQSTTNSVKFGEDCEINFFTNNITTINIIGDEIDINLTDLDIGTTIEINDITNLEFSVNSDSIYKLKFNQVSSDFTIRIN